MGQFSWLDCITEEQVVDNKIRDVYVLVPKEFGGGHIKETCYDGYGRFGGYDIYDLVADWNKKFVPIMIQYIENDRWKCTKSVEEKNIERLQNFYEGRPYDCEKRWIGIMLGCYDEDNERLFYPIKITHNPNAIYENCKPSLSDPNQGWETSNDEDDEEWW